MLPIIWDHLICIRLVHLYCKLSTMNQNHGHCGAQYKEIVALHRAPQILDARLLLHLKNYLVAPNF